MLSRRNFLGIISGGVFGSTLFSKISFSKETDEEEPKLIKVKIKSKKEHKLCEKHLNMLKAITWDFANEDLIPADYIDGYSVHPQLFQVIGGHHITPDFVVYSIIEEGDAFPVVKIHPAGITKCNIAEGWIEYYEIVENVENYSEYEIFLQYKFVLDKNDKPILHRLENMQNLIVNVFSRVGEVLVTLRGDKTC